MSVMHWVIVVGVVTVLFGKNKISGLMKDLGGGLRELKNGLTEVASDSTELTRHDH